MTHILRSLNRVGAWELINDENGGGDAVLTTEAGITLTGKLGARDILHSQDRAVRKCADDHVFEFRRVGEPALNIDRILELRAGFRRWLSYLSGGRYKILLTDN